MDDKRCNQDFETFLSQHWPSNQAQVLACMAVYNWDECEHTETNVAVVERLCEEYPDIRRILGNVSQGLRDAHRAGTLSRVNPGRFKPTAKAKKLVYKRLGEKVGLQAGLFDALTFHPRLVKLTDKLFRNGHYAQAVQEAAKGLINFVKEKSRVTDKDGYPLMMHVFKPKDPGPVLAVNDLRTQSDRDEQTGYQHIFGGVALGVRNPYSHDHRTLTDPLAALHILSLLNHLYQIVERSHRRTT